jgi:hypothetical protein
VKSLTVNLSNSLKIGDKNQTNKQTRTRMTKITNNSLPAAPEVTSSKIIKYRLAIKQPEEWKIRSIAQFKQKQRLKQIRRQQAEMAANESATDGKKKSAKATPVSSSSSVGKEEKVPKENEIKSAYESHVRELANCHFTSTVAKARITALHSVRISLLWLLKKASLHERSLIQDHLQPLPSTTNQ